MSNQDREKLDLLMVKTWAKNCNVKLILTLHIMKIILELQYVLINKYTELEDESSVADC